MQSHQEAKGATFSCPALYLSLLLKTPRPTLTGLLLLFFNNPARRDCRSNSNLSGF
jgi:hypothetical protein